MLGSDLERSGRSPTCQQAGRRKWKQLSQLGPSQATGRAPGQPPRLRDLLFWLSGHPGASSSPSSCSCQPHTEPAGRATLRTSPVHPRGFHLPFGGSSSRSSNLSGKDIVHMPEPGGVSSGSPYRVMCVRTVSVPASPGGQATGHSSGGEGKQVHGFPADLLLGDPNTCLMPLAHAARPCRSSTQLTHAARPCRSPTKPVFRGSGSQS